MKKILCFLIIGLFLSVNANAGNDGKNEISKSSNGEVKDCFEGLNRGIFAFNNALDRIII